MRNVLSVFDEKNKIKMSDRFEAELDIGRLKINYKTALYIRSIGSRTK